MQWRNFMAALGAKRHAPLADAAGADALSLADGLTLGLSRDRVASETAQIRGTGLETQMLANRGDRGPASQRR